jgi:hypothetical protein
LDRAAGKTLTTLEALHLEGIADHELDMAFQSRVDD